MKTEVPFHLEVWKETQGALTAQIWGNVNTEKKTAIVWNRLNI